MWFVNTNFHASTVVVLMYEEFYPYYRSSLPADFLGRTTPFSAIHTPTFYYYVKFHGFA